MDSNKKDFLDYAEGDFAYYKVLRVLEEERVFLVTSLVDGTVCAIKISLKNEIQNSLYNLKREFVMHANFQHPNIVSLGQALEDDTRFGFTTCYIGGGDLRTRIKSISRQDVVFVLRDIALGLAHIHEKGFAHTDIKPENILISTKGVPLICDFGLARDLKVKRSKDNSELYGTTKYVSPEYVLKGDYGTYTDIYSLGLIAVELFAGSIPGEDLKPVDMLKQRVMSYDKSVYDKIPSRLKGLIMSSLEVKPENRIRDGAQFVESINQYIEEIGLEESIDDRQFRLRVSSDIRPVRLRKRTEPIRVDKKAA